MRLARHQFVSSLTITALAVFGCDGGGLSHDASPAVDEAPRSATTCLEACPATVCQASFICASDGLEYCSTCELQCFGLSVQEPGFCDPISPQEIDVLAPAGESMCSSHRDCGPDARCARGECVLDFQHVGLLGEIAVVQPPQEPSEHQEPPDTIPTETVPEDVSHQPCLKMVPFVLDFGSMVVGEHKSVQVRLVPCKGHTAIVEQIDLVTHPDVAGDLRLDLSPLGLGKAKGLSADDDPIKVTPYAVSYFWVTFAPSQATPSGLVDLGRLAVREAGMQEPESTDIIGRAIQY